MTLYVTTDPLLALSALAALAGAPDPDDDDCPRTAAMELRDDFDDWIETLD